MKTLLRSVLLFSAVTLLLAGCKKEQDQHGKAPENIGDVSLNRTRIGGGQPIIATCNLPSGGENIYKVEYYWLMDDGISHAGKETNNKSTFEFSAPKKAGEYKITFMARYIFGSPDKDGNINKDISTTKTYTTVDCDAHNSFWGDNLAETMLNNPSLKKLNESTYTGTFPDPFSMSTINPPLIPTTYILKEGKLSQIIEEEIFESTAQITSIFSKYLANRLKISKFLGVNPENEIVVWQETKGEKFNPEGDDAYKLRISQEIMNNNAMIASSFRGKKTEIRLTVEKETATSASYMRNYIKAEPLQ